MGTYGSGSSGSSGGGGGGGRDRGDIVHNWTPPPSRNTNDAYYKPPPPAAPRKTFDQARQEAKPTLPVGQKSPRAQISCLTKAGIVVSLDTTGSMDDNPKQIWHRAPLVAKESARAMGLPEDEVSMAFITHGDAFTDDNLSASACVVCGPEIDGAMMGLGLTSNGGGNRVESYDLVLAYLERYLVMGKRCEGVDIFLVGDEGIPLVIDPDYYRNYVGGTGTHANTSDVVNGLRARGVRVHIIMMTNTDTNARHHKQICQSWEEALGGRAGIWKLSDPRRIGDLMLLILGWQHGRLKEAKSAFEERQRSHEERRFAEENIPLTYAALEAGIGNYPASASTGADGDVEPMPIDK